MSYKHEAREHERNRVERIRRACGGSVEVAEREADKAVHAHERHDHKGEPLTKLKGEAAPKRLDRKARKDGGRAKSKKGTEVNIIIAPDGHQAGAAGAAPVPAPIAARPPMPPPMPPVMPAGMPPVPPGAMGAMGAPPMARPPMPMPMRKAGGRVPKMTAGAGSGRGRLEKAAEYGARR